MHLLKNLIKHCTLKIIYLLVDIEHHKYFTTIELSESGLARSRGVYKVTMRNSLTVSHYYNQQLLVIIAPQVLLSLIN